MKYGEVLTWEQILLELSWSVLILKRKIILDNGVFIKGIDWENNSVFEIMCVHLGCQRTLFDIQSLCRHSHKETFIAGHA